MQANGNILTISPSNAWNSAGTIQTGAGTITTNNASFINTGTISGTGTLNLGTGTLTNNGTIAPGVGAGGTGTLSITAASVDLSGGNLNIDVGGKTNGTYDKVAITGNLVMGGGLTANLLAGYTPANGDYVPFLTRTGTTTAGTSFTTTTLPTNFNLGYHLAAGESARFIYAPANVNVFTNGAGSLNWETNANWSRNLIPVDTDEALISSGYTISHSSGAHTIGALTIGSSDTLNVTGGSLTVLGATNVTGVLTLNGGNFYQTGNSSIAALNLTNGSLGGAGSVTVTNSFSRSTGNFANTLTGLNITQASSNLSPGAININGPISLTSSAGSLTASSNITSNGALNLKAATDLTIGSGTLLNTQGGHLLLQSNTADAGGAIVINSAAQLLSGGGNITLTGGSTGSATSGYAQGRNNAGDYSNGVFLNNVTLASSSGDISIRGYGASTNNVNGSFNVGPFAQGIVIGSASIDAGAGTIAMNAVSRGVGLLNSHGLQAGLSYGGATGTVLLRSSSTSSTAISLTGDASQSSITGGGYWNYGVVLHPGVSVQSLGTTGGVSIWGRGGANTDSTHTSAVSVGNISASGGPISIYSQGTGGSGNILLTGSLTALGSSVITVNASGNISSPGGASAVAPIRIGYDGTNAYTGNITLTTPGTILIGTGSSAGGSTLINTSGSGEVKLISNNLATTDGTGTGAIFLHGANIDSGLGGITLGGGSDGSFHAGGAAYPYAAGNEIGIALLNSNFNSHGGNIFLRGKGGAGTEGQAVSMNGDGYSIQSGGGNIVIDGIATNGINQQAVLVQATAGGGAYTTPFTIDAGGGNLTITGDASAVTSASNEAFGVVLRNGSRILNSGAGTTTITGVGGIGGSGGGLVIRAGAMGVTSTGSGAITLNGTGAGSGSSVAGILIEGGSSTVTRLGWDGTNTYSGALTFETDYLGIGSSNVALKTTGVLTVKPKTTSKAIIVESAAALSNSALVANANLFNAMQSGIGNFSIGRSDGTGSLSVGSSSFSSPVTLQGGAITLNGVLSSSAGGNALTLIGSSFNNTHGTGALIAPNGRWLVYASNPGSVTKTGLTSSFRHYNANYANYGNPTETGNGFIYASNVGSLAVDTTLTGTANHTYGNDPTATASYTLSGFADSEDTASNIGLSGNAAFNLPGRTGDYGSYSIGYLSGLTSTAGYTFTQGTTKTYNVNQRALTISISGTKQYDRSAVLSAPTFTLGNVANNDSLTLSGTASFADWNAGTSKTLTASGITLTGTKLSNYTWNTSASGTGTITARPITILPGAASKTYDGNTSVASLASTALNNVISSDLASLGLDGTGTYDTRHVGNSKSVSYTGLALTGSAAGNYTWNTTATGSGSITQLASVAWTGQGGDNRWSNPANWAGGALPDYDPASTLDNVAKVTIATGTNPLTLTDTQALRLRGTSIDVTGAGLTLDITGGIFTGKGTLLASNGKLALIAHSPISIGSGGLSASQGISLSATTPEGASTILIDGPMTSTSGPITLDAYGNITQNANLSGSSIQASSSTGNIVVASTATSSVSTGGTLAYAASKGTLTTTAGNFAGSSPSLTSQSGSNIAGTTTGSTPPQAAATQEITTALNTATDNTAPADSKTSTPDKPADAPVTTTTPTGTSGSFQLASLGQTIGGGTDQFGTAEPAASVSSANSGTGSTASTSGTAEKPAESKTSDSKTTATEKKDEKAAAKDDKKEDKNAKDDKGDTEKKESKSAAQKKVAQCS
jgi:hypothetical protein